MSRPIIRYLALLWSFTWEKILTKHYVTPVDRKTNCLHLKVANYTDGNITAKNTIGKWHIPRKGNQSKLHVQSNYMGNWSERSACDQWSNLGIGPSDVRATS